MVEILVDTNNVIRKTAANKDFASGYPTKMKQHNAGR